MDKCQHLCKIDSSHYPREAESFEMRIQELRKSFEGLLQVTIFPATKWSITGFLLEKLFPSTEPKEAKMVECCNEKSITIIGKVSRFNLQ